MQENSLLDSTIELEHIENEDFKVKFRSNAINDITITLSSQDFREGIAEKLLAASVAYCTGIFLLSLLKKVRVKATALKLIADASLGRGEHGLGVVNNIKLRIQIEVPAEDVHLLKRCEKILQKYGCLIGRSLENGIKVNYIFEEKRSAPKNIYSNVPEDMGRDGDNI